MAFLCCPCRLIETRFALLNTWPASLWCLGYARAYLLLHLDTLTWPWSFDLTAPDFVSSYDILCFIERYSILGDKRSYCVCNCNRKCGGVNVTQDLLGELVQTELETPDMFIGNVVKRESVKGCLQGGAANRKENALRLWFRLYSYVSKRNYTAETCWWSGLHIHPFYCHCHSILRKSSKWM